MKKFKKIILISIFVSTALILPFLVFAVTPGIDDIINQIIDILDSRVIPTLLVLATLVFIWGVIQYIIAGTSEQRKKEGRSLIIWGLIGLLVIVAMWGFVKIIGTTFNVPNQGIPFGPKLS